MNSASKCRRIFLNDFSRAVQMADTLAEADVPAEFITFKYPLPHLAQAFQSGGPVRIVAMGSSSTAGRWDVVPYPYRLELYLRAHYRDRFPDLKIDVVNRGRGGEEAIEELDRFDTDILAERPALVIWQVGTNAVFRRDEKKYDLAEVAAKISEGLARLRSQPMDVLLIDPQYVTAMLLDNKADDSGRMVSLIAAAAEKAGVNVFRRWGLMRHWHIQNGISFERMLDPTDPDKLHQSNRSTLRFSVALRDAIAKALSPLA
jgi:lysophospholipase L1-like esterase